MQRWELDGFVVTNNQGHFEIEGIERLPPGWYYVRLDYDRNGPQLSVHDIGGPETGNDVYAWVSKPWSDSSLHHVIR